MERNAAIGRDRAPVLHPQFTAQTKAISDAANESFHLPRTRPAEPPIAVDEATIRKVELEAMIEQGAKDAANARINAG